MERDLMQCRSASIVIAHAGARPRTGRLPGGAAHSSESATGFPGYCSHIPPENATIATVLRDAGWSTMWVGKNHNTPIDAWTAGSSRKEWPLGQGFDRFYGFIGGEANNWYPSLAEDNRYIDQPYLPEDGYHLSKDLADKAIGMIRDVRRLKPPSRGISGSALA
jgi:arylsulfatase A-like enzyme